MLTFIRKFVRDDSGLTTVEYAVAGSLIALAVVGAFSQLGTDVAAAIGNISTVITTGTAP